MVGIDDHVSEIDDEDMAKISDNFIALIWVEVLQKFVDSNRFPILMSRILTGQITWRNVFETLYEEAVDRLTDGVGTVVKGIFKNIADDIFDSLMSR